MEFKNDNTVTKSNVVWPFYAYAALGFLVACVLLCFNSSLLVGHYFHPRLLAVTHSMAIAWASMIIFGATFQLLPVIASNALHSEKLARWCFYISAITIPFLVYGFYYFVFNIVFLTAALFFLAAVFLFVWNVYKTINKSSMIQGDYIFSSSIYLFLTVLLGVILAGNFTYHLLQQSSLTYLKLHAHLGILGWFLFLIIGVGSKLLPMFFFSKYKNESLLKAVYYMLHLAMVLFIITQTFYNIFYLELISILLFTSSAIMFFYYVLKSYLRRLKRKVDSAMRASSFSMISILLILILLLVLFYKEEMAVNVTLSYGFVIFFGWITLLILGMTFKTLPFIIWNARNLFNTSAKTTPKDLYSDFLFKGMLIVYLFGFISTLIGIILIHTSILQISTVLLLVAAILYNVNVFKILIYK